LSRLRTASSGSGGLARFAPGERTCYHHAGEPGMVNYILLYKIRRVVKKILKDKIADDEIATTPKSCLGCLADDISWEVYYLFKERDKKEEPPPEAGPKP
jgi:hypothetical protein